MKLSVNIRYMDYCKTSLFVNITFWMCYFREYYSAATFRQYKI